MDFVLHRRRRRTSPLDRVKRSTQAARRILWLEKEEKLNSTHFSSFHAEMERNLTIISHWSHVCTILTTKNQFTIYHWNSLWFSTMHRYKLQDNFLKRFPVFFNPFSFSAVHIQHLNWTHIKQKRKCLGWKFDHTLQDVMQSIKDEWRCFICPRCVIKMPARRKYHRRTSRPSRPIEKSLWTCDKKKLF